MSFVNRTVGFFVLSIVITLFQIPSAFAQEDFVRSDRLGITFINSDDIKTDPERYQKALSLGAGWNRFPIYWQRVEHEPGKFRWRDYDQLVTEELDIGLKINAVLLGKPAFYYANENAVAGLYEPIFVDGTDIPEVGKQVNPDNPWAMYVARIVRRYKPGGLLAQQLDWQEDEGISVWEIWNEPDFPFFWEYSPQDYARLLKVAYIVIHKVDPDAEVMFGGLLMPSYDENWLEMVLETFNAEDSEATKQNSGYMDVVGIHSYGDPFRSHEMAIIVQDTFARYAIQDMPDIWLNETGARVWDDYPGPVWAANDILRLNRATIQQQAWHLIQSATFAWAGNVDKVFYHQLYDDCGDQPAGTDFSPHNGELCELDENGELVSACYGEAFGIYRNPSNAVCFSQHPQADTQRPVGEAFRLLTEVFGTQEFEPVLTTANNSAVQDSWLNHVVLAFYRPETNERITVFWNSTFQPVIIQLPARGFAGELVTLETRGTILPDENGLYHFELSPAIPMMVSEDNQMIGGPPYILIEKVEREPIAPTPTSIPLTPLPAPTAEASG